LAAGGAACGGGDAFFGALAFFKNKNEKLFNTQTRPHSTNILVFSVVVRKMLSIHVPLQQQHEYDHCHRQKPALKNNPKTQISLNKPQFCA
jgi:hypothetical protein